ncbi:MAG: DNA repair protein RadA [Coxiellaceae bacterium]|jgi:DNA repair protein RadA/Sms|nr:DNA repair protein RadA [Coxiellaceae bacterium]
MTYATIFEMVSKTKLIYICQKCGTEYLKWTGQCTDCGAWNSITEEVSIRSNSRFSGYTANNEVALLSKVILDTTPRLSTTITELDRVLGGGLVIGSSILVGGDPGIGKSTLLLQALCNLSQNYRVLYITGEESAQQIAMRACRLELPVDKLLLLAETQIEKIITTAIQENPDIIAIDSIQTMYTESIPSTPGGVGQIRDCTAQLVRYAKQSKAALFIVGHVTKEGTLAGPKILEHMVDCVLYFEDERDNRFRIIRATKNRFGAINELGIFAMTDKGLKEITNPSAIFLVNHDSEIIGSAIMVTWEGSRPLLIEVQALVDESHLTTLRRVTVGFDPNRLAILLAVLHRHGGISTYNQDIFINVVGGAKITETAIDLALLLAVISSIRNRSLAKDLVIFGEIGLAGEIRPVQYGQERIKAAVKHGFKKIILPKANVPKKPILGAEIIAVKNLTEALQAVE